MGKKKQIDVDAVGDMFTASVTMPKGITGSLVYLVIDDETRILCGTGSLVGYRCFLGVRTPLHTSVLASASGLVSELRQATSLYVNWLVGPCVVCPRPYILSRSEIKGL